MSTTPQQEVQNSGNPGSLVTIVTATGKSMSVPAESVKSYDFRQTGVLTPSELRHINLRHEQFIRSAAARLALLLRSEFSLQLSRLTIMAHQKLIQTLPASAHLTLFRLEPAGKEGLLALPVRSALGMVDRLLGGAGQVPETARDLSEIETALTDQVAGLLLSEWCGHWPELGELRSAITGHETNSRFLQVAPEESTMLVLSLALNPEDQAETAILAFPYAVMEPFIRRLAPAMPAKTAADSSLHARWKPEFDDIKVPATAEWRDLSVTARELSKLKPGDVLMLGDAATAEVQFRLNQMPKFRARPGLCQRQWAVQLTASHDERKSS